MLVPAMAYKDKLLEKFAKEMYTDRYFYYVGYGHSHSLPQITDSDNTYQWAIMSDDKIVGWFAYKIYSDIDSVENFGLYSFNDDDSSIMRNALSLGKDVYNKMEELIKSYHKVSWRVIGGNPVIGSYDRLCKKFYGNKVHLHDTCKDNHGKYHDEFIYEIIDGGRLLDV